MWPSTWHRLHLEMPVSRSLQYNLFAPCGNPTRVQVGCHRALHLVGPTTSSIWLTMTHKLVKWTSTQAQEAGYLVSHKVYIQPVFTFCTLFHPSYPDWSMLSSKVLSMLNLVRMELPKEMLFHDCHDYLLCRADWLTVRSASSTVLFLGSLPCHLAVLWPTSPEFRGPQ